MLKKIFDNKVFLLSSALMLGSAPVFAESPWDGKYNSTFPFQMSRASVCPKFFPTTGQLEAILWPTWGQLGANSEPNWAKAKAKASLAETRQEKTGQEDTRLAEMEVRSDVTLNEEPRQEETRGSKTGGDEIRADNSAK